jgi:phosphohistidine phosphatase
MSKTLTIIRHATASWGEAGQSDFDRPLTPQGLQDATLLGEHLANDQAPDKMVASPAQRTTESALAIAKSVNLSEEAIQWQSEIYDASLSQLLELVCSLSDGDQSVILIGHNPGLTSLCNHLAKSPVADLPTCGICQINFGCDTWQEIAPNSGDVVR